MERMEKQSKREWYENYRWFFTSSGKLVIGGKSAEQNEEVVSSKLEGNDLVLHTKQPGSPFAVIKAGKEKINEADIKEAAIFCASFSRAWREGKRNREVHIFSLKQIKRERNQKQGTFSVLGNIQRINAELKLALTLQKNRLRAAPISAAKEILFILKPGKISKEKTAEIIAEKLKARKTILNKEEILNALPTGNFEIIRK